MKKLLFIALLFWIAPAWAGDKNYLEIIPFGQWSDRIVVEGDKLWVESPKGTPTIYWEELDAPYWTMCVEPKGLSNIIRLKIRRLNAAFRCPRCESLGPLLEHGKEIKCWNCGLWLRLRGGVVDIGVEEKTGLLDWK